MEQPKLIDVQVTKLEAKKILLQLQKDGIEVTEAFRDLEQKSQRYNVFFAPGMTEPSITYASL